MHELPQFKEAIEEVILNEDGTIDAPVIEPAIAVPDQLLEPITVSSELKYFAGL